MFHRSKNAAQGQIWPKTVFSNFKLGAKSAFCLIAILLHENIKRKKYYNKKMEIYIGILLTFILPWCLGIILYFKDKKIIATIVPFASMLGYTFNTIGLEGGFFSSLSSMPPHIAFILGNIGLLSIESCVLIYSIRHTKIKPFFWLFIITIIATLIDVIFIHIGILTYRNGWNIPCTILGYFISFNIIYLYYLWLRKIVIL
ncbi:MAG: hypothetical protein ACD_26C00150G0003 [uncultured bacterium]|nr:MAG: hypothetical protein ACD_26C00150G0003 [uncultured bacterium]